LEANIRKREAIACSGAVSLDTLLLI
jgi:hypothetical protein